MRHDGARLGQYTCVFCKGKVARVEKGRLITEQEAGPQYERIKLLVVANAMCLTCRAKYLAWIDARAVVDKAPYVYHRVSDTTMDLSFRSTFSDEPGPDDMPEFSVEWVPRLTPWPCCERCGKPRADDDEGVSLTCSDEECNTRYDEKSK